MIKKILTEYFSIGHLRIYNILKYIISLWNLLDNKKHLPFFLLYHIVHLIIIPNIWPPRMKNAQVLRYQSDVRGQRPWLTYMLKSLIAEITDLCQGIHRIIHHCPVDFIPRMQDWFTTMKGINKHFKRLHLQIWSFKAIAQWALIKRKRGLYSFIELIKMGKARLPSWRASH